MDPSAKRGWGLGHGQTWDESSFFFHIVSIVPTAITEEHQQPKINRRADKENIVLKKKTKSLYTVWDSFINSYNEVHQAALQNLKCSVT